MKFRSSDSHPSDPYDWRIPFGRFGGQFARVRIYYFSIPEEELRKRFDHTILSKSLELAPVALKAYMADRGFQLDSNKPDDIYREASKQKIYPRIEVLMEAPHYMNLLKDNPEGEAADQAREFLAEEIFHRLYELYRFLKSENNRLPMYHTLTHAYKLQALHHPFEFNDHFNWFTEGYYVFLVVLRFQKQPYFFCGRTGSYGWVSHLYPTFNTVSHLVHGNTLLNQLIEGLSDRTGIDLNHMPERWMELDFAGFFWEVAPFRSQNMDRNDHERDLQKTKRVENLLIQQVHNRFGKEMILNKKPESFPAERSEEEYADTILQVFLNNIKWP